MKTTFLNTIFKLLMLVSACLAHDPWSYYRLVDRPGPQYSPSAGEPWPKPQLQKNYGTYMIIRPPIFRFEIADHTCDILQEALKRYYKIILRHQTSSLQKVSSGFSGFYQNEADFSGHLDVLKVHLMSPCENLPHESMDEMYEIKIDSPDKPHEGLLAAKSIWGILRGLETFSQLLHPTKDFAAIQVKSTLILDYPRFSFRSVLLDTSRHFLSKKVIFENLDLMAMNKFNVFHWHIVDDQAFPYQSRLYPEISDKGSYHPYTHVYTQIDVAEIIEYARLRGIRVVSEFDTPGHTQAWGPGVDGLLTKCYDSTGKLNGKYGPVDPSNEKNYEFLRHFFNEVATVFPDKYLHLGGDEVDYGCWESSPEIAEFMKKMNYTKYNQLEEYYMQHLVDIVQSFPTQNSYLVWQEVIDNGVRVNKDTIVHVWKRPNHFQELAHVTSLGYRALLSACWYLNYISYGIDWPKYYQCDPHDFEGTEAQKRLVFGGGPTMWGEFVDSSNLIQRLWPRASLPAERLWSNANVTDLGDAAKRLEEHRCRLLDRGYEVQPPNGPAFCLRAYD